MYRHHICHSVKSQCSIQIIQKIFSRERSAILNGIKLQLNYFYVIVKKEVLNYPVFVESEFNIILPLLGCSCYI